jgi:hypothetical protein
VLQDERALTLLHCERNERSTLNTIVCDEVKMMELRTARTGSHAVDNEEHELRLQGVKGGVAGRVRAPS